MARTDPDRWNRRQQLAADLVRFADVTLRSAEDLGDRRTIRAAASASAEAQRAAVELGLTYRDVAELRGVTGQAVYQVIRRREKGNPSAAA